jgi:hypothetical protein
MLREKTLSAAVLDLAGSMAAVGLQGSAALVLGYLVMQRSLLDSFRWVYEMEYSTWLLLQCIERHRVHLLAS